MSAKKILVIDDSATIRRLVDSYLSPAGYQVVLAGNAEDGLRFANEQEPDLILLDHQLPGTTGFEVCRQLADSEHTRHTPVVVSSTLRKKAYVEYADMPNVVDMLPKPYTSDLLETTVSNALDTGALVVESQQQGTAVPEVIQELGTPELCGSFEHFTLREMLDFLTNAGKSGLLEVEGDYRRTRFYLGQGRIAGVTAAGVDVRHVLERLPDTLQSLSPVLKLTLSGGGGGELDGVLELLDRKVLDPRLLRKLLRHQAAVLTLDCFTQQLKEFRFQVGPGLPQLQAKLPLDASLLALLIEGALTCPDAQVPAAEPGLVARRVARGQNLDRAGVSARHMKLLGLLNEPRSDEQLMQQLGWEADELRRVLYGLTLVEAVHRRAKRQTQNVVVYEPNANAAQPLRDFLAGASGRYQGRVVRDRLALQLVLKRSHVDVLVFSLNSEQDAVLCRDVHTAVHERLSNVKWIALVPATGEEDLHSAWSKRLGIEFDNVLRHPCPAETLGKTLDDLFADRQPPARGEAQAAEPATESPEIATSSPTGNDQNDGHYYAIQT
jgi:CheY-like chemotaxis protein